MSTDAGKAKAVTNGHCTGCGASGHREADCPDAKATGGVAYTCRLEVMEEERSDNVACALADALIHPQKIGLDSLSSCHLISNPDLLTDIRLSANRAKVHGLNGSINLDKKATLEGVGEVWYYEGGNVNLLSEGRMIRNGAKRVCKGHTDSKSFKFADGTTLVFKRVAEVTDEQRQLDIYLCDTRVESE